MLKNYFKIAWRNLWKQKIFSAINLFGLVIGLSSCLLIALYVQKEMSFDTFHKKSGRIYRVVDHDKEDGKDQLHGVVDGAFASNITRDLAEVENAFRLFKRNETLIKSGQKGFYEEDGFHTDASIFKILDFTFISSSPETAFENPQSIVLTESLASKLFGDNPALGKQVMLDDEDTSYQVTAVVTDFPDNSHFSFRYLLPMPNQIFGLNQSQWSGFSAFFTYLLLNENATPSSVEKKIPAWGKPYYEASYFDKHSFSLQPLEDIHLYSRLEEEVQPERIGDIKYLYIFGAIAVLILVVAAINYINLATLRTVDRTKEIGIRKVLGANSFLIRKQFAGESLVLIGLACIIAVACSELFLNIFNDMLQLHLELNFLGNPLLIGLFLAAVLSIMLLSGFYPAAVISKFSPSHLIKNNRGEVTQISTIRKWLVSFQFGISILLIICTTVIWKQLNFVQNSRLGLKKDQVISVKIPNKTSFSDYNTFKQKLAELSGIQEVAGSITIPSKTTPSGTITIEDQKQRMNWNMVDESFLDVLGIQIKTGTGFKNRSPEQVKNKVLVNESFVKAAGWQPDEAIGKQISMMRIPLEVAGVVKDYNYESFRQKIAPQVIQYHHSKAVPNYLSVKFNPLALSSLLPSIQKQWDEIYASYPFEYVFLDDSFAQLYSSDQRLANIFSVFTSLAIIIALLGLLGLVGYSVRKRTKEIGIRKVLGATTERILLLLSRDFIKLIFAGFVVAIPLAWYIMKQWLAGFAYRVDIGFAPFLIAGILVVFVAGVIISWQSLKTAKMNPVDSLRSE